MKTAPPVRPKVVSSWFLVYGKELGQRPAKYIKLVTVSENTVKYFRFSPRISNFNVYYLVDKQVELNEIRVESELDRNRILL